VNTLGGYRNAMTFVLCGLDIEAKAALVREQMEAAVGAGGLTWRLARTDHIDASTQEAACASLTVHIQDQDARRAGRAFAQAAVELALASYPGATLTTTPGDASPYGVFRAELVPQESVAHVAVLPDGRRVDIAPPARTGAAPPASIVDRLGAGVANQATRRGPTRKVALGTVVGARSGDKGGDANLGVWARSDAGHAWLREFLTVAELRRLLPECAPLPIDAYALPNLRALTFVVRGLLGEGVGASTRVDPQAKGRGEWLRSGLVDVAEEL
jgi:hypothetical protein